MNDKEVYFKNNKIENPNLIKPLTRIHADNIYPSMTSYKLLGIYLDGTFTFDKQTTSTVYALKSLDPFLHFNPILKKLGPSI